MVAGHRSGPGGQQLAQLGPHSGPIGGGQSAQAPQHQSLIKGEQLQAHQAGLRQARGLEIFKGPIEGSRGLRR
jgi:hypothetical protein